MTQWSAGEKYEPYVGRWSRLVAAEFVAWLDPPAGSSWLDVGCGTGALSETVLRMKPPSRLLGVDSSSAYVEHAREHVADDLAEFAVSDAVALDVPDETFDAVVAGLVLNFVPEPLRAVLEMRRVARAGGVVAAYVWDYPGEMWMMRHFWDVATALDPAAPGAVRGEPVLVLPPGGARVLVHGRRSGGGRDAARSSYRPCSRRSTTTGHRSSAARDRRRSMPSRSTNADSPPSASPSANACPSQTTAPSLSLPGPGPSAAWSPRRG